MVSLTGIIVIAALVVVIALVLKITSGIARTVFSTIVSLLLLASIAWVGYDIWDLQKNFDTKEKLLLLELDGKVQGAFVLVKEKPQPIAPLSEFNANYDALPAFAKEYYKIIVFRERALRNIVRVQSGDFDASGDQVLAILKSETPRKAYVQLTVPPESQAREQAALLLQYPSRDLFKSQVFALTVPEITPDDMLVGIRQGSVRVYPETATFKLLKVLPLDWMARIVHPKVEAEDGLA